MSVNATSTSPFQGATIWSIGSRIIDTPNRIWQSMITRIEAFPQSYPKTMQALEPTIYALFRLSHNHPDLSKCLIIAALLIPMILSSILFGIYIESIVMMGGMKAATLTFALLSISALANLNFMRLLLNIPSELGNKQLYQALDITKMTAAFFNLDSEFVSRLNTWTNETPQLNENWRAIRKEIIQLYNQDPTNTKLALSYRHLHSLPDIFDIPILRNTLTNLNLNNNQLTNLPASIGALQSLKDLDFSNNPTLSELPDEILSLPSTCSVTIGGCNFSEAVLEKIRNTTSAPEYRGPTISYSMAGISKGSRTVPPIQDSLTKIYNKINLVYLDNKLSNLEKKMPDLRLAVLLDVISTDGSYDYKDCLSFINLLKEIDKDPLLYKSFFESLLQHCEYGSGFIRNLIRKANADERYTVIENAQ